MSKNLLKTGFDVDHHIFQGSYPHSSEWWCRPNQRVKYEGYWERICKKNSFSSIKLSSWKWIDLPKSRQVDQRPILNILLNKFHPRKCLICHVCNPGEQHVAAATAISPRCWDTSTGCLWNRKFTSNWRCLSTSHCMILLRHTRRTTVNSSWTWDVDISGLFYTCVVPRTQSQIGNRSFFVAGPRLWDNLPT